MLVRQIKTKTKTYFFPWLQCMWSLLYSSSFSHPRFLARNAIGCMFCQDCWARFRLDSLSLSSRFASRLWHESSIHVIWLIHICDMTYSYLWHDLFMCVIWRISFHPASFALFPRSQWYFRHDAQWIWLISVWHQSFFFIATFSRCSQGFIMKCVCRHRRMTPTYGVWMNFGV